MNYKMIGRIIALILAIEAVLMLPAFIMTLVDGEFFVARAFRLTFYIMLIVIALLFFLTMHAEMKFYAREGLVCVGLCWIVMSLTGCLPFFFSRQIPHYVDALFEIVSGFTTTGASVIDNVERISRGLLYWRSFSHWIGGMGVLIFLLALIPISGKNHGFTLHLMRAESPGPDVGKLMPKMRETAMILYGLYVALTILDIIFLLLGGMPLFDSICHAFGTAGTGGFGIRADSLASYSPYLQWVTTVFMMLFGVNFSIYHLLLLKNFSTILKDGELKLYLGFFFGSTLLITINIFRLYPGFFVSLRHAAFQVATVMTTTGYATVDFDRWPVFSKTILLCLMVSGACAGSTGGGMKWARISLLYKALRRNIRKMLYPRRVEVIRMNGAVVDERIVDNTMAYLAVYCLIAVGSFLIISLDGFSVETNLSGMLACFNNIGPGLDRVGPTLNYANYSVLSKLVLIFDMLAGRLEIFPIIVLFSGSTWTRK